MKKLLAYTATCFWPWGPRPMPRAAAEVAEEAQAAAQLEGHPGARAPEWAARLAAQ